MFKPPKSARHHWWPKGLSKFWADADGFTAQITPNDEVERCTPKAFGSTRNAHHIRFGNKLSPWHESFERSFDSAENNFHKLVDWLETLDFDFNGADISHRFIATDFSCEMKSIVSNCLSSLIVRSPCTMNRIRVSVESYRREFRISEELDKNIIAANMKHLHKFFESAIGGGGKFLVLSSGKNEFIFGDGFLHNFPTVVSSSIMSPRCIIPVTPTKAIMYLRPQSYRSNPELATVGLADGEVTAFNDAVQVYSKQFLFYRSLPPFIAQSFSRGEFLEYESHCEPRLAQIVDAFLKYSPDRLAKG